MKSLIMKNINILLLLLVILTACQDEMEQPTGPVEYCVQTVWENGRSASTRSAASASSTRALSSATGILDAGTGPSVIATSDYPTTINVHCSDGNDFTLTKLSTACSTHTSYWRYKPSMDYNIETINKNTLTFTATSVIDEDGDPATTNDGDRLEGTASKEDITDDGHLQFTLHHTKALVRFAFKVAEKYDRIRYIKIKDVKLNGATAIYPVAKQALVLNASETQLLCYLYIDPTKVTVSTSLTLACTYDVYDKDARTLLEKGKTTPLTQAEQAELASHLTRGDVTNANTFSFNQIKDAGGVAVSTISSGKYYDLEVTIDPDFLYTMSNHDDKSALTVQ